MAKGPNLKRTGYMFFPPNKQQIGQHDDARNDQPDDRQIRGKADEERESGAGIADMGQLDDLANERKRLVDCHIFLHEKFHELIEGGGKKSDRVKKHLPDLWRLFGVGVNERGDLLKVAAEDREIDELAQDQRQKIDDETEDDRGAQRDADPLRDSVQESEEDIAPGLVLV